jgi:ABC-type lipoprotein export system ATPase subunit
MRLLRKVSSEHGTTILLVNHDTRMIGAVDRMGRLMGHRVMEEAEQLLAPEPDGTRSSCKGA